MRTRGSLIGVTALLLLMPLEAVAHDKFDHPAPGFTAPGPPSTAFNSGGKGATWDLLGTFATGNPHSDIDFFEQRGETFASVGTLGSGPNAGGQTIVQLTANGKVTQDSLQYVSSHPSATCVSDPSAALGLQHDVEATPKGNTMLNSTNRHAVRKDTQLLVDATDASGRCHDQGAGGIAEAPPGGLEIIDVTDVDNPVEIGLVSHIGEAHTINIDPKRPHIVYSVTSDSVRVSKQGKRYVRENEDPASSQRFNLDGFEVTDISSCMNLPKGTSVETKREQCRPNVYRYRYPSAKIALGHTLQSSIYGCHELEVYPNDKLACGSGGAMILFDMADAFRDRGTPKRFADDVPRGRQLPCRVRDSSTAVPTLSTGAKVTDCVVGRKDKDLTVAGWLKLGAPALKGVRHVGSAHHQGRGAGGAASAYKSDQDIDFNHEAELTKSRKFIISSDERGGGVTPPGAACSPAADNREGNGGLHAYKVSRLDKKMPARPRDAFRAYARNRKGKKAIFRAPINTQPQSTLCTAHVFQQIPKQNRIFMGWYSQGTQVVDFKETRNGRFVFKRAGFFIPENANQWVSHIFKKRRNRDGTFTYWGATGDFNLGSAGRSAIDVYRVRLPAPFAKSKKGAGALATSSEAKGSAPPVVLEPGPDYAFFNPARSTVHVHGRTLIEALMLSAAALMLGLALLVALRGRKSLRWVPGLKT